MDIAIVARVFKWMAIAMIAGLVIMAGLLMFLISLVWGYT